MYRSLCLILSGLLARCCAASTLSSEPSVAKLHPELDLIGFHKNLTQIPSVTGNEKKVGNWLAASLKSQGYSVEKQYLSKDPERFNVLAWPGNVRDAPVLLSSHIDTVPPFLPYHYNKTSDLISGRGSVDAKGSVAAQVIAVNKLLADGKIHPDNVSVLYVIGEETGGAGMRKANDLNLHPKVAIFGEPTEEKLVSGHKGTMHIDLTAKGKAGHSGYPWLGRSANEVLVRALSPLIDLGMKLPRSDKYGYTTFNIGKIKGGVAGNVIAESATAQIAVRIAKGSTDEITDAVTKAIHHAVRDFLEGDMEPEDVIDIDTSARGYGPIDIDFDVPGFDVMTVNYGTDIPWFNLTGEGQKRYLYGPGTIFVAHSADEKLTLGELERSVSGYQKLILHALGKDDDCCKNDL